MRSTTFKYIPIKDFFNSSFLWRKKFHVLKYSETPSTDGFLSSHRDCLHFKNSYLYSLDRFPVRLQLFGDELEITNPLGSKVKLHELLKIHSRIWNLPSHITRQRATQNWCLFRNFTLMFRDVIPKDECPFKIFSTYYKTQSHLYKQFKIKIWAGYLFSQWFAPSPVPDLMPGEKGQAEDR